jgi:hypothetical protein
MKLYRLLTILITLALIFFNYFISHSTFYNSFPPSFYSTSYTNDIYVRFFFINETEANGTDEKEKST